MSHSNDIAAWGRRGGIVVSRSIRVRLLGAICVALPGCATNIVNNAPLRSGAASEHLRQLTGQEVRDLLVGRTLTHDTQRALREGLPARLTPYHETFRADGRISILNHRAGYGGRYEIIGDRLCITLSGHSPECRYFFRASDGAIMQRDVAAASERMTPIKIEQSKDLLE
jgi:hypothetical protein